MPYELFSSDVCMAIKELLTFPIIRVLENNQQKDVPAFYTFPEVDDNVATPRLIIFDHSPEHTPSRLQVGEKLRDNEIYDTYGNLVRVNLRKHPEPFSIPVYVRLKYKFFEHRDLVRKEVYRRFKGVPRGSLVVNGVPLLAILENEIPILDGVDNDGNKVCQWLFSISAHLDISEPQTVSTVIDYNIDVN